MTTHINGTRPPTLIDDDERRIKLVKVHQADGSEVYERHPTERAHADAQLAGERGERHRERRSLRAALAAAVRDERARTIARLAVRHGGYTTGGARILGQRIRDSRTTAPYERIIRDAKAGGNIELAQEWEQRLAAFRAARHTRRMDMLTSGKRIATSAAWGAGLSVAGLVALGVALAIATKDIAQVGAPIMFVIGAIQWAYTLAVILFGVGKVVALPLLLAVLWNLGRRQHTAPHWALPAKIRDAEGEVITPSIVVKALRDLGVSSLRKAIEGMADAGASMLGPILKAGCGVEVDVHLPSGVSTEEVEDRRRKLAENLTRHEHELYITLPPAPRTVRLWIADSGALDEPVGPSPLVTDPTMRADYHAGRAPWGPDLRGDSVDISLFQCMVLVVGLSNQGKTAALRALALWAALDPTAELRIADLKGIGDWSMFNGLATTLIEGPSDDHVVQATHMLEDAVTEMNRRIMAPKGTKFPPLICIVDETQKAFMCPVKTEFITDDGKVKYGAPYGGQSNTSRYCMAAREIHNQGRIVNVLLWQGTQDPTNENLPKKVREGAHIRASLVVGTESQAKMALGDDPVDGGAAPHKLRRGLDKGTLVATGDGVPLPLGQTSITIRTHFIDDDDATDIAERAKKRRGLVSTVTTAEGAEPVDHLADIAHVLGANKRVGTGDVLTLLARHNPAVYGGWTFQDLTRVLEDAGAAPYKSDGVMVVGLQRVDEALRMRDEEADEADLD